MKSFQELEAEARRQHPEESDLEIARRVAYRAATLMHAPVGGSLRGSGSKRRSWSVAGVAWQAVKILWAVLILLLLGAIAVRAEEAGKDAGATKSAVNREEVLAALKGGATGGATPAFDAPIIFLQDQTNQLAVIPAGKVIFNCSTNMACSWDSANRRFNMTASSTASTAFSALTASLNTNAGTFSASGNSWDFTAATLFKLRAGAGLTTSAAGDLGYDTTAGRWHGFIGAADRLLIGSTNVGVAGQAALSNADGTFTFADPIVSGPDAPGTAPTQNPVQVSGFDGTNVRRILTNTGGAVALGGQATNANTDADASVAGIVQSGGGSQLGIVGPKIFNGTNWDRQRAVVNAMDSTGTGIAAAGLVGQLDDTAPGTVTENQFTTLRLTGSRALHANLRNASGTEIGTAGTPVRTDPTGTTPQPISAASLPLPTGAATLAEQQTQTTSLQKIDNLAHSGSDVALVEHVPISGQLDDTATTTVTENQVAPTRITSGRALHVAQQGALPAGTNNIGDVDVLTLPSVTIGTFPDNEPFNVAQVAGTATSVNGGNIDAGTQRVAPARDAAVCNPLNASQVAVSVSASGSTELVALTSGQTIYVCDVVLMAAGTVNVKLVYGTGTACATGPVDMTGALQHTAQTGWSNSPEGRLKTAAANALCINLSAAINVQGFITYRKAATF